MKKLKKIPGKKGKILKERINEVLSKNSGLLPIRAVNSILEGKDNELPENMSSDIISSLKFCPLTSINVERSFSVYESVFDERESLTTENLAKIMICKCYYSKNE